MNNKDEKWEMFLKLMNMKINETIEGYAGTGSLNIYAWGYREVHDTDVAFGSNHSTYFYYESEVIETARCFGFPTYLIILPNADDEPTPCVMVFKN